MASGTAFQVPKNFHEHSEAWLAEKRRIADEANRKRVVSMQGNQNASKAEPKQEEETVVQQSVGSLSADKPNHTPPATTAKAAASKTNAGAVQRGDLLEKKRPDLAEKVRKGEMKPAEAHRQMKRDEVSAKVRELPDGQYRVIYADPPWKYGDAQAVKGDYGTGTSRRHAASQPAQRGDAGQDRAGFMVLPW